MNRMGFPFTKMEGAGNDFIVLDDQDAGAWFNDPALRRHLCDRHFGIGADGILLLTPPRHPATDYHMRYFNADGNEGSFCGNGARCLALFFFQKTGRERCRFSASDGLHAATRLAGDQIRISLNNVALPDRPAPHTIFIDTGSPHYVQLQTALPASFDFVRWARPIRHTFRPHGVNVNLIFPKNGRWHMRTFERGVEAETLACGTGAVAAAIALHLLRDNAPPITLEAPGGRLTVNFVPEKTGFSDVTLEGPAHALFRGEWLAPPSTFATKENSPAQ